MQERRKQGRIRKRLWRPCSLLRRLRQLLQAVINVTSPNGAGLLCNLKRVLMTCMESSSTAGCPRRVYPAVHVKCTATRASHSYSPTGLVERVSQTVFPDLIA